MLYLLLCFFLFLTRPTFASSRGQALGPDGKGGRMGQPGLRGSIGLPGSQGRKGWTGPSHNGRLGATGQQGFPGEDSIQGKEGATGSTGPSGPKGIDGLPGTEGITGTDGQPGTAGRTGDQGANGPSNGPSISHHQFEYIIPGPPGSVGPIGTNGAKGFTGVGATGAMGGTGPTGVSIQGPTGISGRNKNATSASYIRNDLYCGEPYTSIVQCKCGPVQSLSTEQLVEFETELVTLRTVVEIGSVTLSRRTGSLPAMPITLPLAFDSNRIALRMSACYANLVYHTIQVTSPTATKWLACYFDSNGAALFQIYDTWLPLNPSVNITFSYLLSYQVLLPQETP